MQVLSLFPECSIAISTKDDGGVVSVAQYQDMLEQAGVKPRALVIPTHAHATTITPIEIPLSADHKDINADGLMTQDKLVVLAHRFGDCCPVIILDRRKRALMALHAGWRGMTTGIVGMGILTMQAVYHSSPVDIWVWIGPCIQKDSYTNHDVPLQMQLPQWKNHIHVRDDGFHVDLPGFVFDEARRLGIDETHIINDGRDTYTETETFFSHRKAVDEQDVNLDQRFVVAAWLT